LFLNEITVNNLKSFLNKMNFSSQPKPSILGQDAINLIASTVRNSLNVDTAKVNNQNTLDDNGKSIEAEKEDSK
jgi:hypothetical protein